ncbi:MAG: YopT-type cysteine protease domain-containing protein [Chloroflexota bacterium]
MEVLAVITEFQDSATRFGGRCSAHFSQSLPPFRPITQHADTTREGVCHYLAEQWIVDSAKDPDRFWRRMWKIPGVLNENFAAMIVMRAAEGPGTKRDWKLRYDTPAFEEGQYLIYNGFSVEPLFRWGPRRGGGIGDAAGSIVTECVSLASGDPDSPRFAMILASTCQADALGRIIAHAIAVRVYSTGAVGVFDPNLGEFYFGAADQFEKWMEYVSQSFYKDFFTSYYVQSIAGPSGPLAMRSGGEARIPSAAQSED